jgi:hypothetical protein
MREEGQVGRGQDSRVAASGPRCGPLLLPSSYLPQEPELGGGAERDPGDAMAPISKRVLGARGKQPGFAAALAKREGW